MTTEIPEQQEWYWKATRRFRDDAESLHNFVVVAMEGIGRLGPSVALAEALANWDLLDAPSTRSIDDDPNVIATRKVAEMAKAEADAGYPWLHAHAAVATWAALEACVQDIVVGALLRNTTLRLVAPFSNIKAHVVEYEALSDQERAEFLVGEVARNTGAGLRRGASRFEALLETVKLGGPASKDVRDCLFELSQVRNLVVHRTGRADKRFLENCPQFDVELGGEVMVSHSLYSWYATGALNYAYALRQRLRTSCGRKAGMDMPPLGQRPRGDGS